MRRIARNLLKHMRLRILDPILFLDLGLEGTIEEAIEYLSFRLDLSVVKLS
jgi:hypothetical protein